MWNKYKLVMLPTNEKSKIFLEKNGKLSLYQYPQRLFYNDNPQHLYILSDEQKKEDDWFIHPDSSCFDKECKEISTGGYEILQVTKTDTNFVYHSAMMAINKSKNIKKIIATTDKSLTINITRILGVTRELPQIPQSFIKHFVSEYNKGNIISEVMVEYEVRNDFKDMEDALNGDAYKLKINSDNTINIKSIKDSWNKYEFIANLIKYREDYETFKQSCHFGPNPKEIEEWSNKWIEENL